ncbi:MAG: helix-turn-helix transcriptional regulator [Culicoidibacterales bacterium]
MPNNLPAKADSTSDVERILKLIDFISMNETFSLDELTEQTGLKRRTAQRYLQKLIQAGVEIESSTGRGGGFRVKEQGKFPKMMTNEELMALLFATETLRDIHSLPFPFHAEQSIKRLRSELPLSKRMLFDRLSEVTEFSVSKRLLPVPELTNLQQAAIEKRKLRVEYQSANQKTYRTITPIGIYMLDGVWYCPAFCHLRKDERLFRADRLKIVDFLEFDELVHSTLKAWRYAYEQPDSLEPIIASLSKKGIIRAQAIPWMDGKIFGNQLRADYRESRRKNIIEDLLSFGPDIVVHQPATIVQELRTKLKASLTYYE